MCPDHRTTTGTGRPPPERGLHRPTPFDLKIEEDGNVINVAIEGELDLSFAELIDSLEARVKSVPRPRILCDLNDLEFIDSSGMWGLLKVQNRARENGGTLTIVRCPQPIRRAFRASGLDKILEVAGDSEDGAGPES